MENLKSSFKIFSVFFLIVANLYVWQFVLALNSDLKVVFLDVGEGDSALITTSQGHQILIDGGPGEKVLSKFPQEMPFWDRTIDLVILTHPEYDHLSGLNKVLENYRGEKVLWNGILRDTAVFKQWQKDLTDKKPQVLIAQAGVKVKAGTTLGWVLSPLQNLEGQFWEKDSNTSSVIFKLSYGLNSLWAMLLSLLKKNC
ncbi:MAG: MBL fold metallo-hydrolase [Candidatus Gribaldobacteria bacterium]|nr:MBL fold metallo-hydrolase [Candidatus Gribaldobacteria bacterium]